MILDFSYNFFLKNVKGIINPINYFSIEHPQSTFGVKFQAYPIIVAEKMVLERVYGIC